MRGRRLGAMIGAGVLVIGGVGAFIGSRAAADSPAPNGPVSVRTSVNKRIGGCSYSAEVTGRFERTADPVHRIHEAMLEVHTRLACPHRAPVVAERTVYFAATNQAELASRVVAAATAEYEAARGRVCRVQPELQADNRDILIADVSMTCFVPGGEPAR